MGPAIIASSTYRFSAPNNKPVMLPVPQSLLVTLILGLLATAALVAGSSCYDDYKTCQACRADTGCNWCKSSGCHKKWSPGCYGGVADQCDEPGPVVGWAACRDAASCTKSDGTLIHGGVKVNGAYACCPLSDGLGSDGVTCSDGLNLDACTCPRKPKCWAPGPPKFKPCRNAASCKNPDGSVIYGGVKVNDDYACCPWQPGGIYSNNITCTDVLNLDTCSCPSMPGCSLDPEPTPSPATYGWLTGPWGSCSAAPCHSGTRRRTVSCVNINVAGSSVDDSLCTDSPKPPSSESCTDSSTPCPPEPAPSSTESSATHLLSTPLIIGIAAGGSCLLLVLCVLGVWWYRRRQASTKSVNSADSAASLLDHKVYIAMPGATNAMATGAN